MWFIQLTDEKILLHTRGRINQITNIFTNILISWDKLITAMIRVEMAHTIWLDVGVNILRRMLNIET